MLSPGSVSEHRNNSRRSDAMFPMLMMIMMMTSGHAYVPTPSCSSFSHHQHRKSSSLRRVQPFGVKNSVARQRRNRFQFWSVTNNNDEIQVQDEQQSYDVVKTMSPDTSNESKLDNLIPSTMMPSSKRRNNSFVAANSAGRMDTNRRHTGLSSSVLLPSSLSSDDSDTTLQPLFFQSTNPSPTDSLDVSISKNGDNNNNNTGSWKERLLDVSNFASLLCVLDCTLLPLVSIAIPAISWGVGFILGSGGAVSAATMPPALSAFLAYLPALSHGIALYFVIPVGLLTTIINYFFGHKEVKFSMAALFGVALIYVANSSAGVGIPSIDAMLHSAGIVAGGVHDHAGHVHNACGAMVGAATNMMAHTCPEGWAHRMTNTLGCAFLLGSNYSSRKYMEEKNSGCAASALAEAWGGDSGRQVVCPPGCGCEKPSFGTKGSSSRAGGEMFFQWERKSPVSERSSRFRR